MTVPTPRQLEVIALLADGKKLHEIAEILGISRYTVGRHVTDAFERTGAANSSGLVAMALRNKWIE